MARFLKCTEKVNWEVQLWSPSDDLSGNPRTRSVKFTFSLKPVIRRLIYFGPGRPVRLGYQDFQDKIVNSFYIAIQLVEPSAVRETIKHTLRRWPLPDPQLHEIIVSVENQLQGYTGQSSFYVDVQVNHQCDYIFITNEAIEAFLIQRLMEEYVPPMVPATDESIKKLESKKITTDFDENSCVICLEELSAGGQGILMPCSHMFHGECIQEWLKTSHYCPICRFEMPTEEITS